MLQLILIAAGIVTVIQGDFRITNTRVVPKRIARILGALIMLSGILIAVEGFGWILTVGLLTTVAVIGVVTSEIKR
jgi:glutaminase